MSTNRKPHDAGAAAAPKTLASLSGVEALRRLAPAELPDIAADLRQFVIRSVAGSGGHLAAGLGVVELTVALHYVFDTPRDTLVWDIGHQCYPHKVLTGRRERLSTIRQRHGLSGFLQREESAHDAFGAGHSSTSISAALGMAIANAARGCADHTIAIIGDGALSAGMAYEALNHAGAARANLIVILNDNDMSISESVGALSDALRQLRSGAASVPRGASLFEQLGFGYSGPIDGHDLASLVAALTTLKASTGPQLLHVVTRKGQGYARAEADPIGYHGVGCFDPAQGLKPAASTPGKQTYSQVFGDWLCAAAAADPTVIAITPAMREGSALVRYAREFPDRYLDVGIAEQHSVTLAAGLACRGMKPVVAIYSTFLQRAYDQLIHDVAIQKLPVVFALDRAGMVGPDGATHNGAFDLSFLRCIPGLTVMTPADGVELRDMLHTALRQAGPVAVRYPRTAVESDGLAQPARVLPAGSAQLRRHGQRIALLCFGPVLSAALAAAETLDATVVNMRYVKPLDEAMVKRMARRHELLVTLEENAIAGGAGSAVAEYLQAQQLQVPMLQLGFPDRFLPHGTREQLLHEIGLDAEGIVRAASASLAELRPVRRQGALRMPRFAQNGYGAGLPNGTRMR